MFVCFLFTDERLEQPASNPAVSALCKDHAYSDKHHLLEKFSYRASNVGEIVVQNSCTINFQSIKLHIPPSLNF